MSASEPGVELRHRWRVDVSCVACREKGSCELVMVLLIAFSAQVLSIIGIEWDSSVMIRDA